MLGKQSIQFQNPPCIINSGSIVGSKEGQGPMGKLFDKVGYDDMFGAKTWEEAESALQREALQIMLEKENLKKEEIQLIFAGDLLGQSIASSFGLSSFHTPHIGLYGACSTCGLSISVCSMAVAGGFVDRAACVTSSHFASAEKEFRFPLSYGNQRPLSATWTVTGSAAFLMCIRDTLRGGAAMLTIIVHVDAPPGQAIGIKEDLAQHLERFGDTRVVSVTEDLPEQLQLGASGTTR